MANRSTFTRENNYQIDIFQELYDLSPSQTQDAIRYQQLKMKENKTQSEIAEYNQLGTSLQNYIISPERWNHFCDALSSMQIFIKENVEGYIHEKQTEFQAEIDKFSFKNEYQPTVTYFKKNTVSYQGQSYICLADNVIGISPTAPNTWALIAKQGAKGEQGIRGADGLNFTFKGRFDPTESYEPENVVEYNGSLYYCKQFSVGNPPSDTQYWELAVARGASTLLRTLSNKRILSSPVVNIEIGIPQFNAASDALFVYVNSTYQHQGADWKINPNLTSIDVIDGVWGEEPTHVDFVVFKNMQQEIVYTDGTMLQDNTISDAKLMPDNKVGSLATLTTNNKNSTVDAINEVDGKVTEISGEIAAHSADYEYQTPTVVGTQIRLTKQSDTDRLFFKLGADLSGNITISIDNGVTSKPLVDVDGNPVTQLEKGFVEVVASASFFTLRSRGISGADKQALIEIANEAERNESDLKALFADAVNTVDTDGGINLPANAPWAEILAQIPQIKSGKKWASGSVTAKGSLPFDVGNGGTSSTYYIEAGGLDFLPSKIIAYQKGVAMAGDITVYNNKSFFTQYDVRIITAPTYSSSSSGTTKGWKLSGNAIVNQNKFVLPVSTGAAYEYEWFAIE